MHTGTLTSANGWLICRTPRSNAQLRLLGVPSAGMGAGLYHGWSTSLPSWVEVWAVAAPGREHRLSDAVPVRLLDHVDAIAQAVSEWSDMPFTVFGHSMGSVVAFELARYLRDQQRPMPSQLFVSALRPPWLPDDVPPEHVLSSAELLEAVRRRYGGMPPGIEAFPDVLEWALEVLRADLRALETHAFVAGKPLDTPIAALGGADDPSVSAADLDAWAAGTTRAFSVRRFAGNHRYLDSARADVLAHVRDVLRNLSRTPGDVSA